MANRDLIIDLATIDLNKIVADADEIRRYNPQRFEMEQLTAVIYIDNDRKVCVGYKDVGHDEFWARGHMPGMPLMPGVIMCEAAAQLSAFYTQKHDLLGAKMIGFGGMEDVRFRDPVIPGDRLYIAGQMVKARRGRMIVSRFQGFVRDRIVVEGIIKGIPLPIDGLAALRSTE